MTTEKPGNRRRTTSAPHIHKPAAKLVLRDDLRDAEGQPRACLALPSRRVPIAFASLGAALAALREMEAAP